MTSLSTYLPGPAAKLLEPLKTTHDLLRASAKISSPGKSKSLLILTIPNKSLNNKLNNNPFSSTSDYESTDSDYETTTSQTTSQHDNFSEKLVSQFEYHKDEKTFQYKNTQIHSVGKSKVVLISFDQLQKKVKFYGCGVCGKNFSRHENLWSHKRFCQENFEFPCSVCGQRLKSERSRDRHFNRNHGKKLKIVNCLKNEDKNADKNEDKNEDKIMNENKDKKENKRSELTLLNESKKITEPTTPMNCSECGKTQNSSIFASEHASSCKKYADYWCSYCGLRCTRHDVLLNHLEISHSIINLLN